MPSDMGGENPLSMTSAAFAARWSRGRGGGRGWGGRIVHEGADGKRVGGRGGAIAAYRAMVRDGVMRVATDEGGEAGEIRVERAGIVRMLREESDEGEVVKFVQRLPADGVDRERFPHLDIESVLIPMIGSSGERTYTLCVSSQVGCAMGCGFCETAQMGLIRSLTVAEIVGQWHAAAHEVGIRPQNIVFMGMGEPLDNIEAVLGAIEVLTDQVGAGIAMSQITVSTVGRVDGIRRLAEKVREPGWHRLGLALSLNAPNDAVRSELMPVNRKWNLAEVQRALREWPEFAGNKICVEYVLIPGVNDSMEAAAEVAEFVMPLVDRKGKRRAIVNVIPYNPRRESPWPAPSEESVTRFLEELYEHGVFAKRRRTKGRRMMGACGQLGSEEIRRRRLVQVSVPGA
ncbi:MAG: 23S rRNA (adenine(2503)-C(2))-methyltransferase RlmN [Phycisphaerales bacterium]|nr:MAG: 23S rRNA (adenine(2503)-C(2))-methyltransferase RlmN [Phycisphaerales bacterium]